MSPYILHEVRDDIAILSISSSHMEFLTAVVETEKFLYIRIFHYINEQK